MSLNDYYGLSLEINGIQSLMSGVLLERNENLLVRVLGEQGEPLPGAAVTATIDMADDTALTDSDGIAEFSVASAQAVAITVTLDYFQDNILSPVAHAGGEAYEVVEVSMTEEYSLNIMQ